MKLSNDLLEVHNTTRYNFYNDQSVEEYKNYLLIALHDTYRHYKARQSMNEHQLTLNGAVEMVATIIDFIEAD